MSDPIAEAAANLNDAAPSSTEPVVVQAAAELPNDAATPPAGAATPASTGNVLVNAAPVVDAPNVGASGVTEQAAPVAEQSAQQPGGSAMAASGAEQPIFAEHPHTSILRRLTETLRRKWNVFDGELEAILRDAESRL